MNMTPPRASSSPSFASPSVAKTSPEAFKTSAVSHALEASLFERAASPDGDTTAKVQLALPPTAASCIRKRSRSQDDQEEAPQPKAKRRRESSGISAAKKAIKTLEWHVNKIDKLDKHKKGFNQELEDSLETYNQFKKEHSRAEKAVTTSERDFTRNLTKYDDLSKRENEHECAIEDLEEEIERRKLAIADIRMAKRGIDLSSKQKEEARAVSAAKESKCKAAKRNVDVISNMLGQAAQAHNELSEVWLGWEGKEVFDDIGLPFSYPVLETLTKPEIKVLHKALKVRGFSRAADFSFHAKSKSVWLKEVCEAVGIPIPIEVPADEKNLVAASASKIDSKIEAWTDFLAAYKEPDQYNSDEPDSDDDDEATDVEEV